MKKTMTAIFCLTAAASLLMTADLEKKSVFASRAVETENEMTLRLYGTFAPGKVSLIYAPVAGVIERMAVQNGEKVRKGQLLFNLNKDEPGFSAKSIPVVAPFAGLVRNIVTFAGGSVSTQNPVLAVASVDPLHLYLEVNERDLKKIRPPVRVQVRVEYLEQPLAGTMDLVMEVNPARKTAQVRVIVPDADGRVIVGSEGVINHVYGRQKRLLVPAGAIQAEGGGYCVWTVRAGTADRRRVEIGELSPEGYEIISGISAGDMVIYYGYQELEAGEEVSIQEPGK